MRSPIPRCPKGATPFFPPSDPARRLLQGPPAKSKLVTGTLLLAAGAIGLRLLLATDPLHPDKITLVLSGLVVALTALIALFLILRACFRHLRGISKPPRRMRRRVVVLALLVLWSGIGGLHRVQRPRSVDMGITSDSDDGRYTATASTWHRKRLFGDDLLAYQFVVEDPGGSILRTSDIPVPVNMLAEAFGSATDQQFPFADRGTINWHGRSVVFAIGAANLHTIDL